jgi:hypothetical protein
MQPVLWAPRWLRAPGDAGPAPAPAAPTAPAFSSPAAPRTLTTACEQPDTIRSSSNATHVTRPVWPCSVAMRRPLVWLHSRTAEPSPLTTLLSSTCHGVGG